MRKYYYSQLNRGLKIQLLEVLSFEMNMYLVKITLNGESGMLYEKPDALYRFTSKNAVREAFQFYNIEQAWLTQHSAYDEMVGNPPRSEAPLKVQFTMQLPY